MFFSNYRPINMSASGQDRTHRAILDKAVITWKWTIVPRSVSSNLDEMMYVLQQKLIASLRYCIYSSFWAAALFFTSVGLLLRLTRGLRPRVKTPTEECSPVSSPCGRHSCCEETQRHAQFDKTKSWRGARPGCQTHCLSKTARRDRLQRRTPW